MNPGLAFQLSKSLFSCIGLSLRGKFGAYRSWPPRSFSVEASLETNHDSERRLRRLYDNATRDAWDGPLVLREANAKHGGVQLSTEKRIALSYPLRNLLWGELAAWTVSADLAERLENPDARMAASSQAFDEARHFYLVRDYLSQLHVPIPPLDPYFAAAARSLLAGRDLTVKLIAMQLLVEGMALGTFQFLSQAGVEPVLSEILPYIERDESRHVGLGILHLPERLGKLSPRQCRSIAVRVATIDLLVTLSSVHEAHAWRGLNLDPRELHKKVSGLLLNLSGQLGFVPGTNQRYFLAYDPSDPDYLRQLEMLLPSSEANRTGLSRLVQQALSVGARLLPA
jgi:hypothetical protein